MDVISVGTPIGVAAVGALVGVFASIWYRVLLFVRYRRQTSGLKSWVIMGVEGSTHWWKGIVDVSGDLFDALLCCCFVLE